MHHHRLAAGLNFADKVPPPAGDSAAQHESEARYAAHKPGLRTRMRKNVLATQPVPTIELDEDDETCSCKNDDEVVVIAVKKKKSVAATSSSSSSSTLKAGTTSPSTGATTPTLTTSWPTVKRTGTPYPKRSAAAIPRASRGSSSSSSSLASPPLKTTTTTRSPPSAWAMATARGSSKAAPRISPPQRRPVSAPSEGLAALRSPPTSASTRPKLNGLPEQTEVDGDEGMAEAEERAEVSTLAEIKASQAAVEAGAGIGVAVSQLAHKITLMDENDNELKRASKDADTSMDSRLVDAAVNTDLSMASFQTTSDDSELQKDAQNRAWSSRGTDSLGLASLDPRWMEKKHVLQVNRDCIMESQILNALVFDYLKSNISDKVANMFKKEAGVTKTLPPGSPSITEVIDHYQKTAPQKRKLSLETVMNGTPKVNGTSQNKNAKEESRSEEDSNEEEEPPKKATPAKQPAKQPAKKESRSEEGSNEEEDAPKKAVVAPPKKSPAAAKKKESSSEEDSDDDDEVDETPMKAPAAASPKKAAAPAKAAKKDSSDDDEEEEAPKKAPVAAASPTLGNIGLGTALVLAGAGIITAKILGKR